MKRNLFLQFSLPSRNYATTFFFAQQRSSQIPTLCSTCSVIDKLMVNSLYGSLSFRRMTFSSQHLRVRRPSFSSNSSQPSPLTPPVPPSIPTFPMNISFISLRMILGTETSSSTSEPKISVTTSHAMIVVVFATRPPVIFSSKISYIGEGSTPYFIDA